MTKLMTIMKTDAYMSLIIITTTMENLLMHTIKKTKEPRTKETRRKPVDALPKEAARVFRTFVRVDAFPSFLVRTVVMMMTVLVVTVIHFIMIIIPFLLARMVIMIIDHDGL